MLILVWPIAVWTLGIRGPDPVELGVGVLLVCAGAALRLAAVRRLGRGARVHRAGVRGQLAVTGPYAWSRNPLYLAAGIVLVGLAYVSGGGGLSLLLLPATIAIYTPAVLSEERALADADPAAFRAYAQAVPRWIGMRRAAREEDRALATWGESLRREFRLIPWLATAVIGILALRQCASPIRPWLDTLQLPLVVGVGLFVAALGNSVVVEWKQRRWLGMKPSSRGRSKGRSRARSRTGDRRIPRGEPLRASVADRRGAIRAPSTPRTRRVAGLVESQTPDSRCSR